MEAVQWAVKLWVECYWVLQTEKRKLELCKAKSLKEKSFGPS